jgi:transmembrane serine protease 6
MMCAGHRQGGKDACQGDSGGPLMMRQDDGRWVLIGIVSAGYSCAKPGQPGIYHKVSKSSDWISYVTHYLTH